MNSIIRTMVVLELVLGALLQVGCQPNPPARVDPVNVRIVRGAESNQQSTIAFSHTGNRVITVITRLDYSGVKEDFSAGGSQEEGGFITLVTPDGSRDITRSGYWYDLRTNGLQKVRLNGLTVDMMEELLDQGGIDLNYSNFVAWSQRNRRK